MTRRILSAVGRALRPAAASDVHFHNDGSHGQPVPCFDGDRCARPQLDLR